MLGCLTNCPLYKIWISNMKLKLWREQSHWFATHLELIDEFWQSWPETDPLRAKVLAIIRKGLFIFDWCGINAPFIIFLHCKMVKTMTARERGREREREGERDGERKRVIANSCGCRSLKGNRWCVNVQMDAWHDRWHAGYQNKVGMDDAKRLLTDETFTRPISQRHFFYHLCAKIISSSFLKRKILLKNQSTIQKFELPNGCSHSENFSTLSC